MSRPIKLRAWDKINERMLYFEPFNGVWDCEANTVIEATITEEPRDGFAPGEESVLMQYTGLKDKNSKEIYEGDILKHDLWKIPVKVFWEYGGFMAQSTTGELGKRSYTDGTLYDMQLPKCRIIGNIYENPELLT